jgi:hypothetical protein
VAPDLLVQTAYICCFDILYTDIVTDIKLYIRERLFTLSCFCVAAAQVGPRPPHF